MAIPEAAALIGGTELFVFVTVSGIIAAGWVYRDARGRSADHPALWAAVVGFLFLLYFVVGIVALVLYLGLREQLGPAPDTEPTNEENLADPSQ